MESSLIKDVSRARLAFEHCDVSWELLANLYRNYNPNVEVNSFLKEASKLFPALNCGLAAVYLKYELGKGEIVNGSYNGHNHTFLKIDEIIIDITADQFGGPAVYAGPLSAPWSVNAI